MVFTYLPHQSNNPYELLAISILRQAYLDIYNYFRNGEPDDHEGEEALKWLKGNGESLKLVIQAIQIIQERRGWDFGGEEYGIRQNLLERVKTFRDLAEGKNDKKADEIFKAWQLMSS